MESKKYYRSIKRRLENERASRETSAPKIVSQKQAPPSSRIDFSDFYIPKLPRRLKKGLLGGLDYRYFSILIGSFVINILLVLILYQNTSFEMNEEKISRMHSRLAQLLLEKSETVAEAEEARKKLYFSGDIEAEGESPGDTDTSDSRQRRAARRGRAGTGSGTPETRIPDSQMLTQEHRAAQMAREGQKGEMSAQIGSMGVFEYLKGAIITSKVDDNFLNYTDLTNEQFVRMMDGMDVSEMALQRLSQRGGSGASGSGSGNGADSTNFTKLKMRRADPEKKAQDLFGTNTPLEEIEAIPIEKNVELEDNPPAVDALSKLKNRTVKRTAAELRATVMSHNKAIQDCYKMTLRKEVSIKGRIVVRISIDPEGCVVDVEILSSTLNNERMENCITHRIRRWKDFGICPTQKGVISFKQTYNFGG